MILLKQIYAIKFNEILLNLKNCPLDPIYLFSVLLWEMMAN